MKKIRVGLVGYGTWGKKISSNLSKFFKNEVIVFKKKNPSKIKNIFVLKKWSDLQDYNLQAIISASNPKIHSELCIYCLKYNIPAFLEKPLATEVSLFSNIKKIKSYKKNIIHINYIYKRYVEFLKLKKTKIKKIILVMGSASNNNNYQTNLWDWGTHCLSILFYFNNLPLKNISITEKFGNFFLKCKFQNGIVALCYFGNNFKKSIKILKILYSNKKKNIVNFNKFGSRKSPLVNSLSYFFKDINKKNNNIKDIYLSEKITKTLIKLKKL